MLFFFKVRYYNHANPINACIDDDETIFFKASDIATILGYKKPAEVIRTHVKNSISLDVLMNKDRSNIYSRVTNIPSNSKMITADQVYLLLSRIKRPYTSFQVWFSRIMNRPLKCSIELKNLLKTDHVRQYHIPIFTLDAEGDIILKNLKRLVNPVKTESGTNNCVDESTNTSVETFSRNYSRSDSITVQPVVCLYEYTEESLTSEIENDTPEQSQPFSQGFINEPLKHVVLHSLDENGIPLKITYETENYKFEYRRHFD